MPDRDSWPFTHKTARLIWSYVILLSLVMGTTFVVFAMRLTYLLLKVNP